MALQPILNIEAGGEVTNLVPGGPGAPHILAPLGRVMRC
jgi:hypothetical protein